MQANSTQTPPRLYSRPIPQLLLTLLAGGGILVIELFLFLGGILFGVLSLSDFISPIKRQIPPLTDAIPTVIIELMILAAMIWFASITMHFRLWMAHQHWIKTASASSTPQDNPPPSQVITPPELRTLFLRNTAVSLIYLPLLLGSSWIALLWLADVQEGTPTAEFLENWDRVVLSIVFAVILISFWLVQQLVDTYVVRWRTLPALSIIVSRVLSTVVALLINLLIVILPLVIVISIITTIPLPEDIRSLVIVGAMFITLFISGILLGRVAHWALKRAISNNGTNTKSYEDFVKINQNSSAARLRRYIMRAMYIGMGLLIGYIFLFVLARSNVALNSTQANQSRDMFALLLIVGGIIFLMIILFVLPRIAPNKKIDALLKEAYAASFRGDHESAIRTVDQAMDLLPNWETQANAAGLYVVAGRLEESEALARKVLDQLLPIVSRDQSQKAFYPIIGNMFGILAGICTNNQQFDQAKEMVTRGLGFIPDEPRLHNTYADLILNEQESPQEALAHLERAGQAYTKNKQSPSPSHLVTKAWALILIDKEDEAFLLLNQARAQAEGQPVYIKADNDVTEGKIFLIQGKREEARASFEKAQALDPTGLIGQIANTLIATLDEVV